MQKSVKSVAVVLTALSMMW